MSYASSRVDGLKPEDANQGVVFVVDDDLGIREALTSLLMSAGMQVFTFQSVTDFLSAQKLDCPSCLVLDLQMPGKSGLELQRELIGTDGPPIIFISGHGDIPSSVQAMKAGAVEFLPKPFTEEALLEAIHSAIARDRVTRLDRANLKELQKRYASLTKREREVLPLVVSGLLNKQSAAQLGIAEITLQVHRGRIMAKMGADSVHQLVRMADKLGVS